MPGNIQGHRVYDEEGFPINSTNPFHVTGNLSISSGNISVTVSTITAKDLIKPTNVKLYNLTMNTVSSFTPLTLTALTYGFTVNMRANTTTAEPPDFDFAMTSTGTPFSRTLSRGTYWEEDILLDTNTVLYFSALSQTSCVIEVTTKT